MRQNCPSITDKGTQTLTFDAQFPHDIGGSLTDCRSFVCSKLHTYWCVWPQADGKTASWRLWRYDRFIF